MTVTTGNAGVMREKGKLENRITARGLRDLLEKQKYRCALTGRLLTPETASVDHREPLSAGGDNTINNVQIVHGDVNQAKGSMSQEQFVQMCREVAAWTG